tara:strand:+ start:15126 stop:16493 length:1368 start_codon:yes stop_codon:yes gene_type:complete
MKFSALKTFLTFSFIWVVFFQVNSQNYVVEIGSNASSKETLPFMLTANKFGTVPNNNNVSLYTSIFSEFKNTTSDFDFNYKAAITGYLANKNNIFINELFASIGYKNWRLTAGSKNDEIQFEGLSMSNGNIIKSNNTRAFPGINLTTKGYLTLPFAKNWLTVKMNYAEYFLNDKRAVDNAHLHHKSLFFKSKLSKKLSLITGLDHYVIWGGTSKEYGKQPHSFKDYLKYITGQGDGDKTNENVNSSNAWGNHLGNYLVQLDYQGQNSNWNFYWSHLFEDRSGREFANYPDALYGFFIDLKKPKSLVTHIITEFQYTKNMSGLSGISGYDNYFNNTIYTSGWTYFGSTIGSPFFTTRTPVNGITPGIDKNRFTSINLGFKGYLSETIQYKTNLTYTNYDSLTSSSLNETQFSPYLEIFIDTEKFPFNISFGTAADFGDSLPDNFGGFIKLTKNGIF